MLKIAMERAIHSRLVTVRTFCLLLIANASICVTPLRLDAQSPPSSPETLMLHGRFDVRGQYGTIPGQTTLLERDFEWWRRGDVGFWQYHLELGGESRLRENVTVRLTLTARSRDSDRDYVAWGNEVGLSARVKEASISLNRLFSSRVALSGGRQQVAYPMFTLYDYVGGRLTVRATSWLSLDWGQWQVFEGRNIELSGQSSDDIDLWGPQAKFVTPTVSGKVYALIHSKAGGSDGVSNNVRLLGLSATTRYWQGFSIYGAGVYQHGNSSAPLIGQRTVRAWAFRGNLILKASEKLIMGLEYWQGSGDDPGTGGKLENFQQFGYRNSLAKSSQFYRPGLSNLRLVRFRLKGTKRSLTGSAHIARVGESRPGKWFSTEVGIAVSYAYSKDVSLRWRYGSTFNGDRMQVFEMSSGFIGNDRR
ncbi:MAG: hypothetical protein HOH43_17580 [Candidatus Latescibacteria bacterium]|jgi:hypothetical protein|nr:hypothetical protein [Candidatus Latescibacterota bacterium]